MRASARAAWRRGASPVMGLEDCGDKVNEGWGEGVKLELERRSYCGEQERERATNLEKQFSLSAEGVDKLPTPSLLPPLFNCLQGPIFPFPVVNCQRILNTSSSSYNVNETQHRKILTEGIDSTLVAAKSTPTNPFLNC